MQLRPLNPLAIKTSSHAKTDQVYADKAEPATHETRTGRAADTVQERRATGASGLRQDLERGGSAETRTTRWSRIAGKPWTFLIVEELESLAKREASMIASQRLTEQMQNTPTGKCRECA